MLVCFSCRWVCCWGLFDAVLCLGWLSIVLAVCVVFGRLVAWAFLLGLVLALVVFLAWCRRYYCLFKKKTRCVVEITDSDDEFAFAPGGNVSGNELTSQNYLDVMMFH